MIIRYLIIATHDGYREKTFELYPNLKQMTGCQGDLRKKQYRFVKMSKQLSPEQKQELLKNEVEMLCYQIIATSNSETEL